MRPFWGNILVGYFYGSCIMTVVAILAAWPELGAVSLPSMLITFFVLIWAEDRWSLSSTQSTY
jgi:hypothetical protein